MADRFTLLNRGKSLGTFAKRDVTSASITEMMAGGKELVDLEAELRSAAFN